MLPFPHSLTLMETTWGTQDTEKITGKGKAMQTISHWADGMKAWQLLHTSLLPRNPSGPSFPKHKLHLLSLLWGGKSVRTWKTRKRGRRGSLALLLPILLLLEGISYLHIPSGICYYYCQTLKQTCIFSWPKKTQTQKQQQKGPEVKNFFKLSKAIKLQTDTKPAACQAKSRCLKNSAHTSKWGFESPEGSA